MAEVTVRLTVHQRWWLRWYLLGLWVCAEVTGLEPDHDKAAKWIRRGIYVRAQGN